MGYNGRSAKGVFGHISILIDFFIFPWYCRLDWGRLNTIGISMWVKRDGEEAAACNSLLEKTVDP